MVIAPATHRFTVSEYYKMAETGILCEDDRVELIDGEIVDMPPIGSNHQGNVNWLSAWLQRNVEGRAVVAVQGPVQLNDRSLPQPDIALLRPRDDFYRTSHPGAGDVLLIVEVSDSTASYDREIKVPLYARSGIPEVWLIDLTTKHLTVFRDPADDGYKRADTFSSGDVVHPMAFPDVVLAVKDLFGGPTEPDEATSDRR